MIPFICPICKSTLLKNNNCIKCSNNHSFDIAREGYINLLPIRSKKSKNPGDNREMMQARRRFLESGSYKPLAVKLLDIIIDLNNTKKLYNILDLGCGEGYYTSYLAENLPQDCSINALDISKVAIRYASKRYKRVNFCVASAYEVPFPDESLDLIIRIYSPSQESELKRILKKGGHLITVTPGSRHLYQIRSQIYKEVHDHADIDESPKGFNLIERASIKYTINITEKELLDDLIDMTPFGWKFNIEKRDSYLDQNSWEIECDFTIKIYNRL